MSSRCIQIYSVCAGWIDGCIAEGNMKYYFNYSYLHDFLSDLMTALLTVHGEWAADERKENFYAVLEPGKEFWKVSLDNGILEIKISQKYINTDGDEISEEVCFRFDDKLFLNDFLAEMKALLKKYGLLGYKTEWEYEFPLSLLLKLADISDGNNRLKLSDVPSEENMGLDSVMSDFSAEADILNELFI